MSVRPIILAEDNEKLRRLYSDLLNAAGFTVMGVTDGARAIALLHKVATPQLIILDIMMPRMDGIETCSRIRKMQGLNPCPILFLTALDRPETLLECLRAGGDDYMMKSAPVTEVLERAQYWSRRGALEDIAERRDRAIRELESITSEMVESGLASASSEITGEQANIDLLAEFLATCGAEFDEKDDLLLRFGYLVGLVEGCFPTSSGSPKRFLRNLIFKTSFIDRREADSLLDNYERVVTQSQFRDGWTRGRSASASVERPQHDRMAARFGGV